MATSVLFVSCKQSKKTTKEEGKTIVAAEKTSVDEFKALTTYLEANGNFINSQSVPAMIASDEVNDNVDNTAYKIIDIRGEDLFAEGHIKNADNVLAKDMLDYFEKIIVPTDFEKIIIVCKSGQSASYVTGIMRTMGYDNVYAMKYGMSSWNKTFAENFWVKNISNDYADKLEKTANAKPTKGKYPTFKTGKRKAKEILRERALYALKLPYKSLLVKAPALFENPTNYYIINYWPEAKYAKGHIPGAVQYTPKKSLGTTADLATLPVDKEVVVYCYTGQHAAFATAYLKMLGYNVKALAYGANSFMNTEMKNRDAKKWHAFSNKKIHDYKVVKD